MVKKVLKKYGKRLSLSHTKHMVVNNSKNKKKEMAKVVVYGTLRKGQSNHYLLKDEKFVGEFQSEPVFNLHSLGGFPGITEKGHTSVKMEVYSVNQLKLSQLDRLEGYSGEGHDNMYDRKSIITPFGMAKIYIYNGSVKNKERIDNGDWVEYYNNRKVLNHV